MDNPAQAGAFCTIRVIADITDPDIIQRILGDLKAQSSLLVPATTSHN